MNDVAKAIKLLKPNSEFRQVGEDYSNIEWILLDGDAPTQKEIDAAIKEIKANEKSEAESKAARRQEILEKLGLTNDEAQLLLG